MQKNIGIAKELISEFLISNKMKKYEIASKMQNKRQVCTYSLIL